MHTKLLHLAASSLALLLLLNGCENAQRDVESQIERSSATETDPGQIDTPVDENGTIAMQPVDGGTIGDENSTVGEIKIDAKNAYRVAVSFSDNYNENGYFYREEIGQIHFEITNLYTGAPAEVENIDEIVLEVEEKNSETDGKYFNFITYSGEEGPRYVIPKTSIKAADDVALKIKDLSGSTNVIFKATIRLKDDQTSTYSLKIPLVIEKNKSSSMAIVPIETRYENGLFIDKFVIHVVDSYGNKAKDGTRISTGVINNPKLYSNALNDGVVTTTDVLFDIMHNNNISYFRNDKGTLDRSNQQFVLSYNAIDTSKDTVTNLDTLIIIANDQEHKPYNLGGWDIKSVDNESTLSLISLEPGEPVPDVSYVIGDEYRYDACSKTLMNAAASTFESTEVKDGIAYAELRYVPAMVGKTVFIYANSVLEDKRIGISRKVTLKGLGVNESSLTCDYKLTGPNCSIRYKMLLNGPDDTPAQNMYLEQPKLGGDPVYAYATASKTDCDGWTTVSIYGIDENQTATVTFGGKGIYDELIVNQK